MSTSKTLSQEQPDQRTVAVRGYSSLPPNCLVNRPIASSRYSMHFRADWIAYLKAPDWTAVLYPVSFR